MQNSEAVLRVYSERGKEGKPLNRLYRQLFNPELYWEAYNSIYANLGARTNGASEDTLDGMSKKRIDNIIEKIKRETYRWNPVRRTYTPRTDGRRRPLGVPSGDDKLLQATMKMLLEAYYEPTFSDRSHGFRPKRGCHTALVQISKMHTGVNWFIEGDIKGCFDNIDHESLLGILGNRIEDGRMLRLISNLLNAGYLEDWAYNETPSGTPQGGIISPLLTNIYMDVLDKWVENELLPRYNRSRKSRGNGKLCGRRLNPEYTKLTRQITVSEKNGDIISAKSLRKMRNEIPSGDPTDDGYRKLEYIRYADDFLLSFAGPKSEAREIREEIRKFLQDRLKLELSEEKTLITHAKTQSARFLGYDLRVMHSSQIRTINGKMWLGIPPEVIRKNMRKYMVDGKPGTRTYLEENSDYAIITTYQVEYVGLVQYYIMAHNLRKLTRVNWAVRTSLLKTLASKHKSSVTKMAQKYAATLKKNGRNYKVLEVTVERTGKKPLIARYGATPLTRNPNPAEIKDTTPTVYGRRTDLIDRIKSDVCEMCGENGQTEVHHVRKLKDLTRPGRKPKPAWVKRMAALRRKTLVTCKTCHRAIHNGEHRPEWDANTIALESRML